MENEQQWTNGSRTQPIRDTFRASILVRNLSDQKEFLRSVRVELKCSKYLIFTIIFTPLM